MLQFYKPNAKITGSACSIYYSVSKGCFFLQLLKQDGWNGKNGTFGKSREDVSKSVLLKLSTIEAAGILLTLEKDIPFKGYHQYPGARYATTVNLATYSDATGKAVGYSLAVVKKDNQDTAAPSASFRIGLYFPEARLLREYLCIGLREILLYRPDETKTVEAKAEATATEATAATPSTEPETPVF